MQNLKTQIFIEETKLTSYSKPACFSVRGNDQFLLTENNTLIQIIPNGDKKTFNLAKSLSLDKKEQPIVFERITATDHLFITSKLQVFRFKITATNNELIDVQRLQFQYAKTLKTASKATSFVVHNIIFVLISKFLFSYNPDDNSFKMYKLFNDCVTSLQIEGDHMYVLASQTLYKFKWREDNKIIPPKQLLKEHVTNCVQIQVFGHWVVMLNNDKSIAVFDTNECVFLHKFWLQRSSGAQLSIQQLIKVSEKQLLLANQTHGFLLSADFTSVQNVFKFDNIDYLSAAEQVHCLNKSTEAIFKTSAIRSISYTKASRYSVFYRQNSDTQINCLAAYFSHKFIKKDEFHSQIELLREILDKLALKRSLVQSQKMKEIILRFFQLVKDFTCESANSLLENDLLVDRPILRFTLRDRLPVLEFNLRTRTSLRYTQNLEPESTSTSTIDHHDDDTTVSSGSIVKTTSPKIIITSEPEEMPRYKTERERRIIQNNLRKKLKIVSNPIENRKICLIRAENRVERLNAGRQMCQLIFSKSGFSIWDKIWALFFIFDKFKMTKSYNKLYAIVLNFELSIGLSRATKLLNSDDKRAVLLRRICH